MEHPPINAGVRGLRVEFQTNVPEDPSQGLHVLCTGQAFRLYRCHALNFLGGVKNSGSQILPPAVLDGLHLQSHSELSS